MRRYTIALVRSGVPCLTWLGESSLKLPTRDTDHWPMNSACQFHIVANGPGSDAALADDRRAEARPRKIVLIDLENMMFGQHASTGSEVNRSAEILELAQARRPTDMLVVGCNPQLAFTAKDLFPQAQIVTGKGKDGADHALIDTVDLHHAAGRFDELCIVSGDHAFATIAHAARQAGLSVRVVAPHFGLSTALRVYADTAVMLPDLACEEIEVL